MRAAFISKHGGPEVLEVGELPVPEISSTEVLVRVKYGALNHLDIWVRMGLPGLSLTFPHVLGGDASGIVEKTGKEVSHVKEGDEVIVHPGLCCLRCERCLSGWESLCPDYGILGEHKSGTHAQFVKAPSANIFLKPKEISFEEAAAIPLVFTTAWQMVKRARVKPGDTVLIHAAGSGVSSAAIQIAKLHGAEVIATASNGDKLKMAAVLGADHTIDYQRTDFVAGVRRIAPRGVDVILDHVGKDLWEKNIGLLKWGGKLVTCGATSGAVARIDLVQVFYRQLQILGSTMGSKGDFPTILDHIAKKRLQAVVDKKFSLKEVRQAHERLEHRAQFGKVLLDISV